jgi:hypothetical protein
MQSDLLIEIPVTEPLAQALELQWGRLSDEAARNAFGARFGPHLALALGESLDWDLRAPTPAQVTYATAISKALGLVLPSEVLRYRGHMNEFLDRHNQTFKDRGFNKKPTTD